MALYKCIIISIIIIIIIIIIIMDAIKANREPVSLAHLGKGIKNRQNKINVCIN